MKILYISVSVMMIVAYIITVVSLLSSFDSSFVVIPLICLTAVPTSICIKLAFEGERTVVGAQIVTSTSIIIALYLAFELIYQMQPYAVVAQLALWAFIGFWGMKGSSRRSTEAIPAGGR